MNTVGPGVARSTQAGCPSGQWERTVNPSANAYTGSNPVPATLSGPSIGRAFCVRTGIILAVGGLVGLTVAMGSKLGADAC